jgi:VIT1/CCC1 family predicted Fe2+/Mn2+ transporter
MAADAAQNKLAAQHTPEAIRERITGAKSHSYIGDFVFGAVDGCVTTFAVVAGVAGADLPQGVLVVIVLGLANLLADGFSMAAGNFLGTRSERHMLDRMRRTEEMHIERVPDAEREEIRQIFAEKGFDGKLLEDIVKVITRDRRRWIDTMLTEEWGLQLHLPSPWKAASATFTAFFLAGLVPLLPFLLPVAWSRASMFAASSVATAATFVLVGMAKGLVVQRSLIRSGLETLLIGGGAALLAYTVGRLLRLLFGMGL